MVDRAMMGDLICWLNTDAINLPFGGGTFDAVVSGYLLRNVNDVERALAEQYRVLKIGGSFVSLDTTPLPKDIWHFPAQLYLRFVIPIIGGLIAGDMKAYTYLPASTQRFLRADELKDCMVKVGFRDVGFSSFMGGTMAIHWGVK
jgi:demethylmenaquinone methyltransferase/2-methoxy-6-polyprenyl-1,4-benzoquinol methylase